MTVIGRASKAPGRPRRNPGYRLWIAIAVVIEVGASGINSQAQTVDTDCRANIARLLAPFLAGREPANDNPLFASLRQCADLTILGRLLDATAKPLPAHQPVEIAAAVEAAAGSPELTGDAAATGMIVSRFAAVRDPAARASLSYLLGWRNAAPALSRILNDDSAPEVRAAAAVALRNCRTPPDFAALWRAAKSDPDAQTRAQAYQTLDRFGQLRTADQMLAASRAQTEAASTGRFLGRWLEATKVPAQQSAETLIALAEHTGSNQASGALFEILTAMQPAPTSPVTMMVAPPLPAMGSRPAPGVGAMPIQSLPIAAGNPGPSDLQRALYQRRERITRAALAQFAASAKLSEDAARIAINCALAVNRCGPGGCAPLDEILRATDRMPPALALEASHDIATQVGALYFARRFRQYAFGFLLALLIAVAITINGFVRSSRRVFAIGAGWLMILAAAGALQLASDPIAGVSVWPPLRLWPATALGLVAATLLVSVALTLAFSRKWMVLAALITGEIGWWVVPSLIFASGMTLKMQHYSRDEDWLPFMLTILMMFAGPLLTLALSAAAWRLGRLGGVTASNSLP